MELKNSIWDKFLSNIRYFVTMYRREHPFLFSALSVMFVWVAVLHICLISGWDCVIVFTVAAICLSSLMFLVTVWSIIESKRCENNDEHLYIDAWEKIKIVVVILCFLAVIAMIILTWASKGDKIVLKCISTTVSVLSLLFGSSLTFQLVGKGSILNGDLNLYYYPDVTKMRTMQSPVINPQPLGTDIPIDDVSFNPQEAENYDETIDMDE